MFDAHCHLDFEAFEEDRDAALDRAREAGVKGLVVAGYEPAGWARQRALAARYPEVSVTFGLHPWAAARAADRSTIASLIGQLATTLKEGGAVGVGELGIDRSKSWLKKAMPLQRAAFRAQLALARDRNLPVVLHVVRAHGEVLDTLVADGLPRRGGMVHAFSGSAETAEQYLALGLHLSFCGTICRSDADRLHRALAAVPTERLLLETDAPDQTPAPHQPARNEPAFLATVLGAAARLRHAKTGPLGDVCEANARRLFGL